MIRQLTIAMLILVSLLAAQSVRAKGAVMENSFSSVLLERNYPYMIYLPEDYTSSQKTYPVIYLLHGSFGSHRDWMRKGRLRRTVDRMIRDGQIPRWLS